MDQPETSESKDSEQEEGPCGYPIANSSRTTVAEQQEKEIQLFPDLKWRVDAFLIQQPKASQLFSFLQGCQPLEHHRKKVQTELTDWV